MAAVVRRRQCSGIRMAECYDLEHLIAGGKRQCVKWSLVMMMKMKLFADVVSRYV
jgi:hypothetical protein